MIKNKNSIIYTIIMIFLFILTGVFSFPSHTKVLLFLFIISIWLYVCSGFIANKQRYVQFVAICIFLTTVLSWNYMYNSMDSHNTMFAGFQEESESLVTGMVCAEQNEVYSEDKYGLGRYHDIKGSMRAYNREFITDDDWECGYSRTDPAIILCQSPYVNEVIEKGNYIKFSNGDMELITEVIDEDDNVIVYLACAQPLSEEKNGSIENALFYDKNQQQFPQGKLTPYKSQYGLQGKIFTWMARYVPINALRLLCCIVTAAVFVIIVVLAALKYNYIMAGCFFITFYLSPWIVVFARNLYWVEFTWFVPMAIGLLCSMKIHDRRWRIFCYIASFFSVMIKSLCGYEYMSTIMMSLIIFMMVDSIALIISWKEKKIKILLRTVIIPIVIISITALLGFITAICIHGHLRGDGDIIKGIKMIIESDALRRIKGIDLNSSSGASVWEVFCKYFHFSTEILPGIQGNLFPVLCLVPLCIFSYELKIHILDIKLFLLYIGFFLTSVSWFCLAKEHSYYHGHLNYVLWYFGFVQICFYIIISKIVYLFKGQDSVGK